MPVVTHALRCEECGERTRVEHTACANLALGGESVPAFHRTRRCVRCARIMHTIEVRAADALGRVPA
jgi:hypothetical protein